MCHFHLEHTWEEEKLHQSFNKLNTYWTNRKRFYCFLFRLSQKWPWTMVRCSHLSNSECDWEVRFTPPVTPKNDWSVLLTTFLSHEDDWTVSSACNHIHIHSFIFFSWFYFRFCFLSTFIEFYVYVLAPNSIIIQVSSSICLFRTREYVEYFHHFHLWFITKWISNMLYAYIFKK